MTATAEQILQFIATASGIFRKAVSDTNHFNSAMQTIYRRPMLLFVKRHLLIVLEQSEFKKTISARSKNVKFLYNLC